MKKLTLALVLVFVTTVTLAECNKEKVSQFVLEQELNFFGSNHSKDNFTKLLKLADNGDCYAQRFVARYYREGHGIVEIDDLKALDYFLAAASQGDAGSMYRLALRYLHRACAWDYLAKERNTNLRIMPECEPKDEVILREIEFLKKQYPSLR